MGGYGWHFSVESNTFRTVLGFKNAVLGPGISPHASYITPYNYILTTQKKVDQPTHNICAMASVRKLWLVVDLTCFEVKIWFCTTIFICFWCAQSHQTKFLSLRIVDDLHTTKVEFSATFHHWRKDLHFVRFWRFDVLGYDIVHNPTQKMWDVNPINSTCRN